MEKTNVMRILDSKKVTYQPHCYIDSGAVGVKEVAFVLNQDEKRLFKTLVTIGKSNNYYVFVVPGDGELDLKKAAKAVGEKNIEMIKQKDLLPLTGYIHGGCSPVGMKKLFKTTFDITASDYPTVFFSAGKIGYQIEMNIEDLKKVIPFQMADLKEEI